MYKDGVRSPLDRLLGRGWDCRQVGGGLRVVLTLHLALNTRQQLRLTTHARQCVHHRSPKYFILPQMATSRTQRMCAQ